MSGGGAANESAGTPSVDCSLSLIVSGTASVGGVQSAVRSSGCALCESQGFRPEGLLHNHSLLPHPPTESGPVGGAMQVKVNDDIPKQVNDGDGVLTVMMLAKATDGGVSAASPSPSRSW
jgi:hypothetical protein